MVITRKDLEWENIVGSWDEGFGQAWVFAARLCQRTSSHICTSIARSSVPRLRKHAADVG